MSSLAPNCASGSSSATTVDGCCHCRFLLNSVLISAIYSTSEASLIAHGAEPTPHPCNCPMGLLSATSTLPAPLPDSWSVSAAHHRSWSPQLRWTSLSRSQAHFCQHSIKYLRHNRSRRC